MTNSSTKDNFKPGTFVFANIPADGGKVIIVGVVANKKALENYLLKRAFLEKNHPGVVILVLGCFDNRSGSIFSDDCQYKFPYYVALSAGWITEWVPDGDDFRQHDTILFAMDQRPSRQDKTAGAKLFSQIFGLTVEKVEALELIFLTKWLMEPYHFKRRDQFLEKINKEGWTNWPSCPDGVLYPTWIELSKSQVLALHEQIPYLVDC